MKKPWMKFYTADWRSDVTLGTCSLAARGLWMEMLCIMSEADPRGSLVQKGVPLAIEKLAALARAPVKEVRKLLVELEENGVFSSEVLDGNHVVIFSRRMRRDEAKCLESIENGKMGGSPLLKAGVNPQLKTQKPEARSQRRLNSESTQSNLLSVGEQPTRARGRYSDEFEKLWKLYPTDPNMSKKEAFDVWRRLPQIERDEALKATPAFVTYCASNPDYRPVHLCRFLSKRRSEGFLELAEKTTGRKAKVFIAKDTPQWSAWQDHLVRSIGKGTPTNDKGGWWFDSDYPPEKMERVA